MSNDMHAIRLGCIGCEDQHDGISERELGELLRAGWTSVERIRTYEESIAEVELDQPRVNSDLFDWQTHTGYCPECSAE